MIPPKRAKRAKLIRLLHGPLACGAIDFGDFTDDELVEMKKWPDDQWVNFATALMELEDAKLLKEWLDANDGPDGVRAAVDEELEERKNAPEEPDLGFDALASQLAEAGIE